MNDKGVWRSAPATPGLIIIHPLTLCDSFYPCGWKLTFVSDFLVLNLSILQTSAADWTLDWGPAYRAPFMQFEKIFVLLILTIQYTLLGDLIKASIT